MAEICTDTGGGEVKKAWEDELMDVTDRTVGQLHRFLDEPYLAVKPRRLFAIVPDGLLWETTCESGGCGYGDSTRRSAVNPGDTPVAVTQVSNADYFKEGVVLAFQVPGHANAIDYYCPTDTIGELRFLESPLCGDTTYDNRVKRDLECSSFVYMTGDELNNFTGHSNRGQACVRAKDPLGYPIGLRSPSWNSSELRGVALDGKVSNITVNYNTSTRRLEAMIDVDCGVTDGSLSTGWVPMDALEFYETKMPLAESLMKRLYARAQALISDYDNYGQILLNDVLQETTQKTGRQAEYPLPYDRYPLARQAHGTQSRFVIGRLAANGYLASRSPVEIDTPGRITSGLYLPATRVALLSGQPYVVDDETRLATPLVSPNFIVGANDYSRHIADCSSELAGLRGQTA